LPDARGERWVRDVEWTPVTETAALTVTDLGYSYGRTEAVHDVSYCVEPGRVHALLGPNGAGKSTTIALSVGLYRPTRGRVRAFGLDPHAQHTRTAGLVSVMLQDGGLPMASKPLEALSHIARMYANPLDVQALAERLGITSFADRAIRHLSGGQRQRVNLAAALVGRPRLVFLDEPTAGLDPQAQIAVYTVIDQLRAEGVAVVLTTHDMDEAERLADEVTIVDHGRVIAQGAPAALIAERSRVLRIRLRGVPAVDVLTDLAVLAEVEATGPAITLSGELDTERLHAITGVLAHHRAVIDDFQLTGRSLGDVFLDLTGRNLR
jgi:ABC-2 type transport system ATP-binding protein